MHSLMVMLQPKLPLMYATNRHLVHSSCHRALNEAPYKKFAFLVFFLLK